MQGILRRHRFVFALALVTAAAFVARVIYIVTVGSRIEFGLDAIWYELQAGTIATGKGYLDPASYYGRGTAIATANFPPLWPTLLAGAYKLGIDTETGYQLVGAAVGSCTVALTGVLGRRVAGARIGLVAAAITAFAPMLIATDGSLMSESLYALAIIGAVILTMHARAQPTVLRFLAVGAAVGCATLTRSDGLFLAPLLIGSAVWAPHCGTRPRRVLLAGIAFAGMVAILAPWTIRNSSRMGEPVLLSNNSGNVIVGANCASTYGGRMLGAWDARCVPQRVPGRPEIDSVKEERSIGVRYAREHWPRLPLVAATRSMRAWGFWDPVAQARLEKIESRNTRWQLAGWSVDMAMFALAVPGAILLARRQVVLGPLIALVVAVTIAAAISNGNQRFRVAAQPVVAIAAATALVATPGYVRGRRAHSVANR